MSTNAGSLTPDHGPRRRLPAVRSAAVVLLTLSMGLLAACGSKAETAASSASTAPVTVTAAANTAEPSTTPAAQATDTTARTATTTTATSETVEKGESPQSTVASGPSCRTVDLGGLTVSVDCDSPVPDPESGVTLTKDSVYGLPGESFDELADVDATNRVVTTADGKPVVIYLLGSDTLFDVGSSTVKPTAEAALPAVVASITQRAPNAEILVRGFTDSTGSATANQTLSEQRAAAMVAWLAGGGLPAARMQASGYGSTKPAAAETSELGTALNRRIEIVAVG